ncbi:MAG: DUF3558 family protein [Devosia sp.]
MKVRASALVVIGVVVLGLAGCTTRDAGTPTSGQVSSRSTAPTGTGPSESSMPSSEEDTYGAPRVESPLDATKFLADPCAVLTPVQLPTFGVSQPGRGDTEGEIAKTVGPLCIWTADPEVDSTISVAWQSGNKNGLADLYRLRDRWEYFVETTVEGYPAVFNSALDSRAEGYCTVSVGVSDALTFTASETGKLDADGACARAEQVAAAAIVTLKETQ